MLEDIFSCIQQVCMQKLTQTFNEYLEINKFED